MMENNAIKPIDFSKIFKKLYKYKKLYIKVLPATLIITYLIVFCVPRYYKCTVSLAPELSGGSSISGSLGSLASSFGLGSLAKMRSEDALFAKIYPNILQSNDFIADLMTIEVTTQKGDVKTNYYTYLKEKQHQAWWNAIKGYLIELIVPTPKDSYTGKEKISVFNLTKQQSRIFEAAKFNIFCEVDKKTDVVTIIVKDQDPLVCAQLANATCKKLQEFIVRYRTHKTKIDCEHYEKLVEESKADYVKARQQYAAFADANMGLMLTSYKSKEEDLENEMQLKFNIYNAMQTQLQIAKAKLQEATPAFTIIQSATVPYKPAGPKRTIISIAMTILVFFGMSAWLLFKERNSD